MSHVEVIKPSERILPSLGGTGYQPPAVQSSVDAIVAEMRKAESQGLGVTVLKVKRQSNRHPRRLVLPNGRYLKCRVIGGTGRDWWFVSVSVRGGLRALA